MKLQDAFEEKKCDQLVAFETPFWERFKKCKERKLDKESLCSENESKSGADVHPKIWREWEANVGWLMKEWLCSHGRVKNRNSSPSRRGQNVQSNLWVTCTQDISDRLLAFCESEVHACTEVRVKRKRGWSAYSVSAKRESVSKTTLVFFTKDEVAGNHSSFSCLRMRKQIIWYALWTHSHLEFCLCHRHYSPSFSLHIKSPDCFTKPSG